MRDYLVRMSSVKFMLITIDPENLGWGGAFVRTTFNDDRGMTAFQLCQEAKKLAKDQNNVLTPLQLRLAFATPVSPTP